MSTPQPQRYFPGCCIATKSNNEVCRYTSLQVHTKRPLSLLLPTLQKKRSSIEPQTLDPKTTALPLYSIKNPSHSADCPHLKLKKKAPSACTLTSNGGVLDYRPTHPEYNSKRGEGPRLLTHPPRLGHPPRPPPPVNLIPYKRSLVGVDLTVTSKKGVDGRGSKNTTPKDQWDQEGGTLLLRSERMGLGPSTVPGTVGGEFGRKFMGSPLRTFMINDAPIAGGCVKPSLDCRDSSETSSVCLGQRPSLLQVQSALGSPSAGTVTVTAGDLRSARQGTGENTRMRHIYKCGRTVAVSSNANAMSMCGKRVGRPHQVDCVLWRHPSRGWTAGRCMKAGGAARGVQLASHIMLFMCFLWVEGWFAGESAMSALLPTTATRRPRGVHSPENGFTGETQPKSGWT